MVKKSHFERFAEHYDFLTKLLMMGTYGPVRKRIVSTPNVETALDLCCGTGYVTGYINAQKIVALDLSPSMLKVNQEKNKDKKKVGAVVGDAFSLPFPEDSFDAVYNTLAAIFLRYTYLPFLKHVVELGTFFVYDANGWKELLKEVGFKDIETETLYKASILIRARK
jgi:SAM-dependent methyltransferase